MATYNVITDTHGYPWGNAYNKTIHFDLGDNTPSYSSSFQEPIHNTAATGMVLLGNHDVEYRKKLPNTSGNTYSDMIEQSGFFQYPKTLTNFNKSTDVVFFGLNTAYSIGDFRIEADVIEKMADAMTKLPSGTKVAVLTHVPLFKYHSSFGNCYTQTEWAKWKGRWKTDVISGVLKLLNCYRNGGTFTSVSNKTYTFNGNGEVVGCFCGHIHNSIKCYYQGFYMEAFKTNGASEWTPNDQYNPAMYQPEISTINVVGNTVNNKPFISANSVFNENVTDANDWPYFENSDINTQSSGYVYGTNSSTYFRFVSSVNYSARFYNGVYVGYAPNKDKSGLKPNSNNGYFELDNGTYLNGVGDTANYIRFDASGKLRYYGATADTVNEIDDYDKIQVSFTTNSINWIFNNGLLVSATPTYTNGDILGLNGYSIKFNNSGYAVAIQKDGATETHPAGSNWINVTRLTVYWRPFSDLTNLDNTTKTPQIGITGTFGTNTKIDLARSTNKGDNWIPNRYNVFIRIVGRDNHVYWLYDGRLITLTDTIVGI